MDKKAVEAAARELERAFKSLKSLGATYDLAEIQIIGLIFSGQPVEFLRNWNRAQKTTLKVRVGTAPRFTNDELIRSFATFGKRATLPNTRCKKLRPSSPVR